MRIKFILVFLVLSFVSKAQLISHNWSNIVDKSTIISSISSSSIPIKNLENQTKDSNGHKIIVSSSGEQSGMTITRKIYIKKDEKMISFTLSINRIQQKGNSFEGTVDIDTDSPFPDNQAEKMSIEYYLPFIKNPISIIYNFEESNNNLDEKKYKNLWDNNLPKLHSIHILSGLFLNGSKTSWVDSLYDDKGLYINEYKIISDKNQIYQIYLKGNYISKNVDESTTSKASLPKNGDTVQVTTNILSMNYEGEIEVNKNTGIINHLTLQVNKKGSFSVLGQVFPKNTQFFYDITNKVK